MTSKYFNFEEEEYDFPFYKDKNFLTTKTAIALIIPLLIFALMIIGPVKFNNIHEQLILFFIMFIPFLIATKGKVATLFRKPKLADLKTIILCVLGNFAILFIIIFIQTMINLIIPVDPFTRVDTTTVGYGLDILSLIVNFLQIIAEELFRITLFLILLHIVYKFSQKRKESMIISVIITLLVFGLMHVNNNPSILYIILCIGFSSYFTLHAYLKTKNALLSVIVHLLYNIITILIITTL